MEQEEVRVVINNSSNRRRLSVGESDCLSPGHDRSSILSGLSGRSKANSNLKEDRGITLSDVRAIMPTVLILILTIFIMVTVIPYAFSSVIKQLEAVQRLEAKAAEAEIAKDIKVSGTGEGQTLPTPSSS